SPEDRTHLGHLALIQANGAMCPPATPLAHGVAPTVQALLDHLDPAPAFVVGPTADVVAWNRAWATVAVGLGLQGTARPSPALAPDPAPNLARYVFPHPMAGPVLADWDRAADEQVGRLRAAAVRWGDDPTFAALIDELTERPEFARRWAAHEVGV